VAVLSMYLFEDCGHKVLAIDIVLLVLRCIRVYFNVCSYVIFCVNAVLLYLSVLFKYATFL